MREQTAAQKSQRQRTISPIIFMIVGLILLGVSIFILAARNIGIIGATISNTPTNILIGNALSYTPSSILISVMLFLIGLVNTIKKPSLRWLKITVSILCGIIIGIALLWALIVTAILLSYFK